MPINPKTANLDMLETSKGPERGARLLVCCLFGSPWTASTPVSLVREIWFHRAFLWPFSQVHSPFQWQLTKSILKSSFFMIVLLQILHVGTARTLSNSIILGLQIVYILA
jgi:hypothetical protein